MSAFQNSDPSVRAKLGRDAIAQAYAAADAEQPITAGDWSGLTKAEAAAWCWNFFQYEPYGFVHPAKMIRQRRERELEEGLLPEGTVYAERARSFIGRDITPQQYRAAKEMLEAPTFCWADVRYQ